MKTSRAVLLVSFAAVLAACALLTGPARAADRTPLLASGFGDGGRVTLPLPLAGGSPHWQPDPAEVVAVATDDSGALTVIAALGEGGRAMLRFLPGGELDRSFGGDGVVAGDTVPPLANPTSEVSGLALDAYGRPIVTANDCRAATRFAYGNATVSPFEETCTPTVLRLGNDGRLDPSFGEGGIAAVELGLTAPTQTGGAPPGLEAPPTLPAHPVLRRVAVDGSGRIVLAGTAAPFYDIGKYGALEQHRAPLLVRLGADGQLDRSFGAGGAVIARALSDGQLALDLAIAAGERPSLLVCADNGGHGLLRLNDDGSRDTRFGADGLREVSGCARALAIDAHDRILVLKTEPYCLKANRAPCTTTLHRWKPNGVADTKFSGNGWLGPKRRDGKVAIWRDVLSADRGQIYLGGVMAREDGDQWLDYALTAGRWDGRGRPDKEFGRGGGAIVGFGARELAGGVVTPAAVGTGQRLILTTALAPPPREGALSSLALTAFRPFR